MCFYKFNERLLDYNVSPRAMILYAILADRMQLSKQNDNFKDRDGVFIYFTLEKIQEVLHVAYNTAKNLMKELAANHLIRKKRQGQGQPNKIYVYEFEESENQTEQTDKKTSHKTDKKVSVKTDKKVSVKTDRKLSPNHTNINQTDISYSSIIGGNTNNAQTRTIDDDVKAEVKKSIEYQELTSKYRSNKRTLNLIVQLIAANIQQYSEINKKIVENILDNVINVNLSKVRNFKAYLQACLDNAYAMPTSTIMQSYAPTYDIAEYESHSITDFIDKSDWI